MSQGAKESGATVSSRTNPNDPRRDKNIVFYNKEIFQQKEENSGQADLYQLLSMMIGIFAFMMKVCVCAIVN